MLLKHQYCSVFSQLGSRVVNFHKSWWKMTLAFSRWGCSWTPTVPGGEWNGSLRRGTVCCCPARHPRKAFSPGGGRTGHSKYSLELLPSALRGFSVWLGYSVRGPIQFLSEQPSACPSLIWIHLSLCTSTDSTEQHFVSADIQRDCISAWGVRWAHSGMQEVAFGASYGRNEVLTAWVILWSHAWWLLWILMTKNLNQA